MVTSEVAKVVMGGGTCFKWWWQVSIVRWPMWIREVVASVIQVLVA